MLTVVTAVGPMGRSARGLEMIMLIKTPQGCYRFPSNSNATEIMLSYPAIEFEFEGKRLLKCFLCSIF